MATSDTEQTVSHPTGPVGAHLGPLPPAPYSALSDEDLVVWARQDDAAFAELFSRHTGNVRRRALQRTGSPEVAEQIVEATATRARRTIGANVAGRDIGRWLLDATENECIGWFERGRATRTTDRPTALTVAVTPTAAGGPDGERALGRLLRRTWARTVAGVRAAGRPDRLV